MSRQLLPGTAVYQTLSSHTITAAQDKEKSSLYQVLTSASQRIDTVSVHKRSFILFLIECRIFFFSLSLLSPLSFQALGFDPSVSKDFIFSEVNKIHISVRPSFCVGKSCFPKEAAALLFWCCWFFKRNGTLGLSAVADYFTTGCLRSTGAHISQCKSGDGSLAELFPFLMVFSD